MGSHVSPAQRAARGALSYLIVLHDLAADAPPSTKASRRYHGAALGTPAGGSPNEQASDARPRWPSASHAIYERAGDIAHDAISRRLQSCDSDLTVAVVSRYPSTHKEGLQMRKALVAVAVSVVMLGWGSNRAMAVCGDGVVDSGEDCDLGGTCIGGSAAGTALPRR